MPNISTIRLRRARFRPPSATPADQIDAERDRRIALGVTVTMNSGATIPVQTRDSRDFRNINGLSTTALVLKVQGDKSTTITFRDANNVDHTLTLDQVIEMGLKVSKKMQALYAKSWSLKGMTSLPADYTSDAYWSVS
jgi:hypothetical protein